MGMSNVCVVLSVIVIIDWFFFLVWFCCFLFFFLIGRYRWVEVVIIVILVLKNFRNVGLSKWISFDSFIFL